MSEEITKEDIVVAKYSVKAIVDNLTLGKPTMTYTDLSIKVKELCGIERSPRRLGVPLGLIQDYCFELHLPTLPAVVVRKNSDDMPGEKYFLRYYKNHPDIEEMDREAVLRAEQKACKECESWKNLYKHVGLDENTSTTDVE